ncbi:MAG: cell division protein FtsZ [Rikenellaceae bacterium]
MEESLNTDLLSELSVAQRKSSIITVVGVGGAGGNAVNHMWNMGIRGVDFMICNTDQQALDGSPVDQKIRLGHEGQGAGNDPEEGRRAAIESMPHIRQRMESMDTKMIFITAGMGGGTGTGASPVLAKLAKDMGILTVAIVTSPLEVEGDKRFNQAVKGLAELRQCVDALLIINNENILSLYGDLSLKQAFSRADDILCSAAKGIAEIITVHSDLVNVDFADVCKVMRSSGRAHMSMDAVAGEDRATKVAESALKSPLLDHKDISGAKNILLNISVADSEDLKYGEVMKILDFIQSRASTEDENGKIVKANIIWGTSVKPSLGDALELVIVATGFNESLESESNITLPELTIEHLEGSVKKSRDLEPVKISQQGIAPSRRSETVVLNARNSRYQNIDTLLKRPAYQTRHAKFITETTGKTEIIKEGEAAAGHNETLEGGNLLFD